MNEKGKTYRFTVKLRKKPLQGGRFSLILDYYNGNVEYLSNEQRGERVREHLGLYLIPENSPEDKLANEKTMELAREILGFLIKIRKCIFVQSMMTPYHRVNIIPL